MTISSTSRTAGPFSGTGANTTFPFSYKVFARSDVLVARTVTATSVESLLVLDSDFTVSLNANQNTSPGGVITLAAPLAVGTTLAATSNLPIQQTLSLTNNGGFYPAVINDALDRIVITVQQLAAKVGAGALNIGAAATIAAILTALTNLAASSGAGLVGVIRNATGAVATTLLKWLNWRDAHVFEFMTDAQIADALTGAPVLDHTAAIQAALNSCATLRLPPGCTLNAGKLIITRSLEIIGHGATLLHKAGAAGTGNGLIESKQDFKVVYRGLVIDGNYANQASAVAGLHSMVWNSIGSMQFYDCVLQNSKGHLFESGNINDFNAAKFAHDVVLSNTQLINPRADCGDCARVMRTRGYRVLNSSSDGGFSGFRTQLYCRDVEFNNVKAKYAYADVGITVAMSWRVRINNCEGAFNFQHGLELDACVDYRGSGNHWHNNGRSGLFCSEIGAVNYLNSATYAGSVADGLSADYSAHTYASPRLSCIDAVFGPDTSTNNGEADRFIGSNDDVYRGNFVSNPALINGYVAQLAIEGGTLNRTGTRVLSNTFVTGVNDQYAVQMSSYQFTAYVSADNKVIGLQPLSQYPTAGSRDLNAANKYLLDSTKRSALFADVADAASKTGAAITHTPVGDQTYPLTTVLGTGKNYKLLRVVARAASPVTAYLAVNLYDKAGAYLATIFGETAVSLTAAYKEFKYNIPSSASVGNYMIVSIRQASGVAFFMQEVNLYVAD